MHIIKEPEVLRKIMLHYFYSYEFAVPNSKFEYIILAKSQAEINLKLIIKLELPSFIKRQTRSFRYMLIIQDPEVSDTIK